LFGIFSGIMCMHPHREACLKAIFCCWCVHAAALPQKIVTVLAAMFVDAKN